MFAGYLLTGEDKHRLRHLERNERKVGGKEAHSGNGIESARKARENSTIDSSKHSHVKPPAKNPECEIANTPYLKVVGIEIVQKYLSPDCWLI